MERITDYSFLAEKLKKAFRPGVWQLGSIEPAALRREIACGTLFFEESEDSFLMLKKRGDAYRVFGYVGKSLPALPEEKLVCEIAYREKDAEKAKRIRTLFEKQSFGEILSRCRRMRECGDISNNIECEKAASGDAFAVMKLLRANFDPLAGCIPTEAELLEDIAAGNVYIRRNAASSVCAVLHIGRQNSYSEIRHLCVSEEARQLGYAGSMISAYLSREKKKSRVWARCGNVPAEKLYEKYGFEKDGFYSVVLSR